jgi:hypothetical protein
MRARKHYEHTFAVSACQEGECVRSRDQARVWTLRLKNEMRTNAPYPTRIDLPGSKVACMCVSLFFLGPCLLGAEAEQRVVITTLRVALAGALAMARCMVNKKIEEIRKMQVICGHLAPGRFMRLPGATHKSGLLTWTRDFFFGWLSRGLRG